MPPAKFWISLGIIFFIIFFTVGIFLILIGPKNEGYKKEEKEEESVKEEEYLMIQSSGKCQEGDGSCEQETQSSLVLEYDKNRNMDILNTSVPCGIPGGQESITTIYYDKQIMFVLVGNDCTYLDVPYKKGDVVRIPYGERNCIIKGSRNCKVTKIEGLNTYNKNDEKLNQTIVFDYYNESNLLYKIDFPTNNEPYLWVMEYNDSEDYTTNKSKKSVSEFFPDGNLSSSMSSDDNRFFFTIWDSTSSLITTYNRNYDIPFTSTIKYGNELYTASFPVVDNGIFKHDFYVLKADIGNNCDKRCYTMRLYNPVAENNLGSLSGAFVSKDVFERYLRLDTLPLPNPVDYPIYQIYGIGDMLYLPHTKYIYEVDISSCYTVYVPAKNITNPLTIPPFDDSGSLSIFDEKLYSIASEGGKQLSYWKQDKKDSSKSEWVVVSDHPYGGAVSMAMMISDIKQGIVVPKPYSNLEFTCQQDPFIPASAKKSKKERKSFKNLGRK